MELFKITIGIKKKFYESKQSFETYWKQHVKGWSKWYTVVAYQMDFKNKCWKEIRRIEPKVKK
jgi:hypothetical protein